MLLGKCFPIEYYMNWVSNSQPRQPIPDKLGDRFPINIFYVTVQPIPLNIAKNGWPIPETGWPILQKFPYVTGRPIPIEYH